MHLTCFVSLGNPAKIDIKCTFEGDTGVLPDQAGSVASLMQFAMASAASNPDPSVRNSLSPGVDSTYPALEWAACMSKLLFIAPSYLPR